MAKILVLLLTLFTLPALAQQDYTSGEGHFGAQEGDKPDFVKAQLLYEATKDVVTKEMAAMGFNHELFWQKYNERLNASLKILEDSLKTEKKRIRVPPEKLAQAQELRKPRERHPVLFDQRPVSRRRRPELALHQDRR